MLLGAGALYASWAAGTLTPAGGALVVMVGVWTLRLGLFLFRRIHRVGQDVRFSEIKTAPWLFLVTWTLQAVWAFITMLPVLILLTRPGGAPGGGVRAG